MRKILHLDMNSYFATAAQQANPLLRGKPVGIVKAQGRGCVIAASVEAKKFGVKTGATVWDAQKLCPQIRLVPADMDQYFSLTERLIKITEVYSPVREIFSIDELFVDLTDTAHLFPGGEVGIAWEIKERIARELGVWMRCSVGISFTKIIAKLASEMKKPDGLTVLTPDDYLTATEGVGVDEICGVGYARTRYLHARGAYTIGQARRLPDLPRDISDLVFLRRDEPLNEMAEIDPAKSVSRTFTTFKILESPEAIEKLVRNLTEEACMKLREMEMAGRTFGLSLSVEDTNRHTNFWVRRTVVTPTADPLAVFNFLWQEYVKFPVGAVRQAGVYISNLVFNLHVAQTLFPIFKQRQNLLKIADDINRRWGLFTLYPARLLGGELVRPEVTGYLGDKYYRFRS